MSWNARVTCCVGTTRPSWWIESTSSRRPTGCGARSPTPRSGDRGSRSVGARSHSSSPSRHPSILRPSRSLRANGTCTTTRRTGPGPAGSAIRSRSAPDAKVGSPGSQPDGPASVSASSRSSSSPPTSRGEGVGSHLLAAVEDLARRRGCRTLALRTEAGSPAAAFYADRGWRVEATFSEWLAGRDFVQLRRDL